MGIKAPPRLALGALLLICSAAALAQNAITTAQSDLYAGPDNAYPVVAQLDPNTPVQVMGCLDDWSWCDVSIEDARGWMYSPDITYYYEGGYVPLYSYAPSLGIAVVPFSVDVYWGHYYHDRPWYGRREEWAHRTVEHRRPPGPPPSAGPPPRPEHREGPREAARDNDRPLHLGRAGTAEPSPQNRNDERRNDAGSSNLRGPDERRPEDRRPGESRANEGRPNDRRPEPPPAPRPDMHAAPAPHPAPETHAAPPPHEEHARPGGPPAGGPPAHAAPHEEHRAPPPKEEEHPH
jgi:uncharacterized protein YraI